jgi:hypothetical protein
MVAGIAIGQLAFAANFVFFDEFVAQLDLAKGCTGLGVDARVAGLPAHRPHRFAGTHEFLGVTMAVQTPLHREGVHLHRKRSLIDPAVAGFAANALLDVQGVVEIPGSS